LPGSSNVASDPRKSPVQARSIASVDAILVATVQVLLHIGKERLTTRIVAERAGVAVGTLYQYFPNKTALLRAVLNRHFQEVTTTVERVCREQHAKPLKQMATALIKAFLEAKMKDIKTSVALYSVSSDIDGARLVRQTGKRSNKAIVDMLSNATEQLLSDSQIIAEMLQGALAGVSRRLLESDNPESHFEVFRRELIFFACAYLEKASLREH
jgi:AcrR family transcriptional regulator